jgi:hypothetical protein
MKNILQLLCLMPQALLALHIHNIQIGQPSAQSINISLTTEAVELYYYDSWNYSITGNVITINAYFIEGFGSTISYLNNNFEVPLSVPQNYLIVVRIFYTDNGHTFRTPKDMARITFRFPRDCIQMQGFKRTIRLEPE